MPERKNILQINTVINAGSTGRIAEEIGNEIIQRGFNSYVAFGRGNMRSISNLIKTETIFGEGVHLLKSRLFDLHGFGSTGATRRLVCKVKEIDPDIVHLHNLHGFYLHVGLLFDYLKTYKKPTIWTFHDCWPFTGHCAHFDSVSCFKWQTQCETCPMKQGYPKSWLIDNSKNNYIRKKELFTGLPKIILVSPSQWLADHLHKSFLSDYDTRVIYNGVDLSKFKPTDPSAVNKKFGITRKYILGVAGIWNSRKGLEDFIKLRVLLTRDLDIVLAGLTPGQIRMLPAGIVGIRKTDSIEELAALYSGAEVFVNPTYVDNFPTVNIESLACGTPVITYNTGGSPEAVDDCTGVILKKGDIAGITMAIDTVIQSTDRFSSRLCRERAELMFSATDRYQDYIKLYEELIS